MVPLPPLRLPVVFWGLIILLPENDREIDALSLVSPASTTSMVVPSWVALTTVAPLTVIVLICQLPCVTSFMSITLPLTDSSAAAALVSSGTIPSTITSASRKLKIRFFILKKPPYNLLYANVQTGRKTGSSGSYRKIGMCA